MIENLIIISTITKDIIKDVSNTIAAKDVLIAITVAGGALTTAITVLWKTVMTLSKKQVDMSKELGKLQGRQDGIRELSYKVLDTVYSATASNKIKRDNDDYDH